MDQAKPFEVIAARYQISGPSAKYFLGRVQKSFKKEKPPEALILEFLQDYKFKTLPKPYQVAALMNERGVWVHPMHAEPPSLQDEPDVHF
jgi:hypothetical protein